MKPETEKKALPEGWEKREGLCWVRRDGAMCWANRNRRFSAVVEGLTLAETTRALLERHDPIAAMEALDREYPMEAEHGEK